MRSNCIRHAFFKTSVINAAKISEGNIKNPRTNLIDDNAKDFLDSVKMKNVLLNIKKVL